MANPGQPGEGRITAGPGLLASRMAVQMRELVGKLPASVEKVQDYLGQYPWGQFLLQQWSHAGESSSGAGELLRGGRVFSSLTGFLEAILVIFVVGIFGA